MASKSIRIVVNQFPATSAPPFFWYCFTSQADAVEEERVIWWQLTTRSDRSQIVACLGQGD
jgi:hypothetical protein